MARKEIIIEGKEMTSKEIIEQLNKLYKLAFISKKPKKKMEAKRIARDLYERVKSEGMSTSNCYAPDFDDTCKWFAKNRAKRKYFGSNLEKILIEIDKL